MHIFYHCQQKDFLSCTNQSENILFDLVFYIDNLQKASETSKQHQVTQGKIWYKDCQGALPAMIEKLYPKAMFLIDYLVTTLNQVIEDPWLFKIPMEFQVDPIRQVSLMIRGHPIQLWLRLKISPKLLGKTAKKRIQKINLWLLQEIAWICFLIENLCPTWTIAKPVSIQVQDLYKKIVLELLEELPRLL